MGLEQTPCNQCRILTSTHTFLPSIVDGPRVCLFRLKSQEGTETLFKVAQAGVEHVFSNLPVQVQAIRNEVTLFNQLIPVEQIERMDRHAPLYVLVMDMYKPWLKRNSEAQQLTDMLSKVKFLTAHTKEVIERSQIIRNQAKVLRADVQAAAAQDEAEIEAMMAESDAKMEAMTAQANAKVEAMIAESKAEMEAMTAQAKAENQAMTAQSNAKVEAMIAQSDAERQAMTAQSDAKMEAIIAQSKAERQAEVEAMIAQSKAERQAMIAQSDAEVKAMIAQAEVKVKIVRLVKTIEWVALAKLVAVATFFFSLRSNNTKLEFSTCQAKKIYGKDIFSLSAFHQTPAFFHSYFPNNRPVAANFQISPYRYKNFKGESCFPFFTPYPHVGISNAFGKEG